MFELIFGLFNLGNLFLVGGIVLAVLALFYVPLPLTHYVVDILLVIAFAGKIYFVGYGAAEKLADAKMAAAQARFEKTMADISAESAKAVLSATEKVRQEDEANAAALKKALDDQAAEAAITQEGYERAISAINSAPKTADGQVDPLILGAIRGMK